MARDLYYLCHRFDYQITTVERGSQMNYSTAVFLINKNIRAVLGVYDPDDKNAKRTPFKTLSADIKIGDFAVVPTGTRHNMTVVKIVDIDVDIDFDSVAQVEWVIAVVDRSEYEKTLEQEAVAIQAIKSAELRQKRDSLRKALFADHVETLKALPIAAINGDHAAKEGQA
jgi:hypothetical protein